MTDCLEGGGYLFQANRLVTPVHYRLRWSMDDDGRSSAEGELWARSGAWRLQEGAGRFLMHTQSGLSVPLEITTPCRGQWLPFRRIHWEEVAHGAE